MKNESVDYHLLFFLKKLLDTNLTPAQKTLFKSQFACQTKQVAPLGVEPAVFLMRSDKNHAKLAGLNHCNNPWICPVCSAHKMSKYRQKIAVAIEAMKAKGFKGFMITFTVPHCRWFSTEDTFEILKNSMKKFQKRAYNQKNAKKFSNNAWSRMYRDMELCHYVRMAEVTFGKNGIHPHYHAIYWTNKNLQLAKNYEEDVSNYWNKIVKEETLKQLKKSKTNYSEEMITLELERFYKTLPQNQGLYFSKNDKDQIFAMESSAYISGWGSDKELTQQERKTAAEGHYTQWDLLEILAGHKDCNLRKDILTKWFLDFAIYTKKNKFYRAKFSQTEDENKKTLHKIIKEYLQTNTCMEFIKKNYTENWHVVCWFNNIQWFKICELNRIIPVLSNILYLSYDTKLLQEYLESLEIFAFDNPEHQYKKAYEDLFNKSAA